MSLRRFLDPSAIRRDVRAGRPLPVDPATRALRTLRPACRAYKDGLPLEYVRAHYDPAHVDALLADGRLALVNGRVTAPVVGGL